MPVSKSTATLRKSKIAAASTNGTFSNAELLGYYRTMLLARYKAKLSRITLTTSLIRVV